MLPVASLLAALALVAPAQRTAEASPRRVSLVGIALGPHGEPAEGAVVVTSAGGRAVVGVDGTFQLALELPSGTRELDVSAARSAGATTWIGHQRVDTTRGGDVLALDPLALAPGAGCQPAWLPTFGSYADLPSSPFDLIVFDDGTGPSLYAGGNFFLARREGDQWVRIGEPDGLVLAFAVYDDGNGPALYAAGSFEAIDGVRVRGIARWDGARWTTFGPVIGAGAPTIRSLAVHDDGGGGGPALYVAGSFLRLADGTLSPNAGRWSARGWEAFDAGLTGNSLSALTVLPGGPGEPGQMYAIESYIQGGSALGRLVRRGGSSWSIFTDDFGTDPDRLVAALAVFEEPRSLTAHVRPSLIVAGTFRAVEGVPARNVARWDGQGWSALAEGPGTPVQELLAVRGLLYAGGDLGRTSRWDGLAWTPLPPRLNETAVTALAAAHDARGTTLFVGAGPDQRSDAECYLSTWDGTRWSTLDSWLNGSVLALATFDDGLGGGPALYVGGTFTVAGGTGSRAVARFDGTSWSGLARGMRGEFFRTSVNALVVHDDGSGPALFAAGEFVEAGGRNARNVAKWDGTRWSALGAGLDQLVLTLVVFDDGLGGGPALYAGGLFTASGATPIARVARWDGTSWSALGTGPNQLVRALAVHDEGQGAGPALFAGGQLTSAGGVAALRIARWNGVSWSPLGGGLNSEVYDLCTYDDGGGGGPALYAAGAFTLAGGQPARGVARWDGVGWSALGTGLSSGSARALAVLDDGSGPGLFVGGSFATVGGLAASRIVRWDGATWAPLAAGIDSGPTSVEVLLASSGLWPGPALLVGGIFRDAGGTGDSFLGRWQGCPAAPLEVGPRPRVR
ncbi:MAG TPA: hypothetical protein VF530_17815 [Planctomycetota bacterium]